MPSFDYVALDSAGRERRGSVTAPNEAGARASLSRRKLLPVRLAAASGAAEAGGRSVMYARRRSLSAKQLSLFTRQLSTLSMVSPLEEALRTISVQADQPEVRQVVDHVHGGLLEGRRLADAMGRERKSFPPLYRAMVAAGESSGALPAILERLADLLERQAQVRGKLLTALAYPAMLALTAISVVIGLMVFVVPKVVEQFESLNQALPLLTRIVIALSAAMASYGLFVLLLLAIGGVVFVRALREPGFRLRFDQALLELPFIGRLLRDLHAARLARTLATMVSSGLPIIEGLAITARTVHNRVLRQASEDMVESIRSGGSLSAALRRAGVFPPLLVYMTASGEQSGRLDIMLARAADYLEREFDNFTAAALSLLEPAIIIVMGGIVLLIVLSILLPILQLDTLATA